VSYIKFYSENNNNNEPLINEMRKALIKQISNSKPNNNKIFNYNYWLVMFNIENKTY
jgi:hypothetical protein